MRDWILTLPCLLYLVLSLLNTVLVDLPLQLRNVDDENTQKICFNSCFSGSTSATSHAITQYPEAMQAALLKKPSTTKRLHRQAVCQPLAIKPPNIFFPTVSSK